MEVRTEILSEGVGATHVDGQTVVWPIGDPPEQHVEAVLQALEERKAREAAKEAFMKQSRELRRDLAEKSQARDRLEEAGYDPSEVPL